MMMMSRVMSQRGMKLSMLGRCPARPRVTTLPLWLVSVTGTGFVLSLRSTALRSKPGALAEGLGLGVWGWNPQLPGQLRWPKGRVRTAGDSALSSFTAALMRLSVACRGV